MLNVCIQINSGFAISSLFKNSLKKIFLRFYLFIHDRGREREREREAETQAEGEAGSREGARRGT